MKRIFSEKEYACLEAKRLMLMKLSEEKFRAQKTFAIKDATILFPISSKISKDLTRLTPFKLSELALDNLLDDISKSHIETNQECYEGKEETDKFIFASPHEQAIEQTIIKLGSYED